ncbi:hypothetical protein PS647_03668 [Pseudomonas fluorescens]|nr:hypothetical protein PS647_03668 [Pseudomonas fluorescens]
MKASRAKPLSGWSVTRFLILGQRKQGDRWVKLDETLRSHSPSVNGHLQKRLDCVQRNVFTGAHPLRSLTSAARPVLAVLRHIRSTVRCSTHAHRTTLAFAWDFGRFMHGLAGRGCQYDRQRWFRSQHRIFLYWPLVSSQKRGDFKPECSRWRVCLDGHLGIGPSGYFTRARTSKYESGSNVVSQL